MTKIIAIAGLPCCGKTTLCNSIANLYEGISLDLEYLRTIFFEENIEQNIFKFTKNEPIKEGEDLRAYFLRCVIYEHIVSLDEYVRWYKTIMEDMNIKLSLILQDFANLEYNDFLSKYNKIIKFCPLVKPNLIVLNHALLPLTDVWNKSILSIMLTGEKSVLINRFALREKINSKEYEKDIYRHMKLYDILNKDTNKDFVYDTSNDFMSINKIKDICMERGIR